MRFLVPRACVLVFAVLSVSLSGQPFTFTHWVGTQGGAGDVDGNGAEARFRSPGFVATDAAGNVYISDTENHVIRRITPGGDVSTVAGVEGQKGSAVGFRHQARFNRPQGIAIDPSGNVFVSDIENHVIRKITPGGLVTTFAGMPGASGYVNGTGTAARFFLVFGLACDSAGNVYAAEYGSNTIRKITPAGVVTTFAGATEPGAVDGPGDSARFRQPTGVAVDATGNVYVADNLNHTIRKITPARVVSTIAGAAGACGYVDGPAGSSRFCSPQDLAIDAGGDIYVADASNWRVRKISGATVSTVAGSGLSGADDGTGTAATFGAVRSVAADGSGNVYVADTSNHTVRRIAPGAVVTTFAGLAAVGGFDVASGADGRFRNPNELAVDTNGNIFVADSTNSVIRKIPSGSLSAAVFAGSPVLNGNDDGNGPDARFRSPTGLGIDTANNLYVADSNASTIRKITPAADVTTIAGTPYMYGSDDGTGPAARFNMPRDVAADASGNLYVADSGNHTIRKITPGGVVTTLAGLAGFSGTVDGTGSAARFNDPDALTIGSDGNLYVADRANHAIRKVTMAGVVTTIAGLPGTAGSDDGTGTAARFSYPTGISADGSGNLYVTESQHTVRKATLGGVVTTIAGTAGVPGSQVATGALARFQDLKGIATSPFNAVFVTDGNAVRRGATALPDQATIDVAEGTVGAVRQLSTSSPTANIWVWSIVHRPTGSVALISSPSQRMATFTPDAGGRYTLRLIAALGLSSSVTEVDLIATTAGSGSLTVNPVTLPAGMRQLAYTASVGATGGTPPHLFTASGTLPPGVTLGESGTFSGVATAAGTFNFTVNVTDSVGATGSRAYALTIAAAAPAVEAHATAATTIALDWADVPSAAKYRVYRSASGLSFFPVADVATSSYADAVMEGFAYLYRIVALDAADRMSPAGPHDLAMAMAIQDAPLVAGVTPVRANHLFQLRDAVKAVRFLAGLPAPTYTDTMVPGLTIKALHVTQLMGPLAEARSALALPTIPASGPPPSTGGAVKASHIEDVQAGVR